MKNFPAGGSADFGTVTVMDVPLLAATPLVAVPFGVVVCAGVGVCAFVVVVVVGGGGGAGFLTGTCTSMVSVAKWIVWFEGGDEEGPSLTRIGGGFGRLASSSLRWQSEQIKSKFSCSASSLAMPRQLLCCHTLQRSQATLCSPSSCCLLVPVSVFLKGDTTYYVFSANSTARTVEEPFFLLEFFNGFALADYLDL